MSSGRVLQGADSTHSADSTIEAGLPNITGEFGMQSGISLGGFHFTSGSLQSGALFFKTKVDNSFDWHSYNDAYTIGFDASKSSHIYGSSSTVQPPSYVVHIWKRVS